MPFSPFNWRSCKVCPFLPADLSKEFSLSAKSFVWLVEKTEYIVDGDDDDDDDDDNDDDDDDNADDDDRLSW